MDSLTKMVNRIARLSALYREQEFKKLGLGEMHHAYILGVCNQPGISQEELACKIFINKSNVARQLAQLEQKGFITRKSDKKDARKLQVFPTEKALAIEADIRTILTDWNNQLLTSIPLERQEQLSIELHQIMEQAEAIMCPK
ncbi:MarR family winged helix-turn-helix transcriptional regulator [Enterococcus hermanniensis]|uniref:HTH marR-type domain-containing protein n=1 Tax=Enterococcus hermanniensis TaxID=249189 RepID=A0A1L8TMF1_9ENTE|nr:MarR family transcriptional regulator [Enterococcus hermanniensis]OJG45403.1 hypothetical protein RV04_GL002119 [Enterococcus hermanniensis]